MKIELEDTLSGFSITKINANFQKIEDALNDEVLYRDNPVGEPNQMEQFLDMNGQRIINLPPPGGLNDSARLADIVNAVAGIVPAAAIPFSPAGSIAATNVQDAIEELDADVVEIGTPDGSDSVGFIESGVGAVALSVQDKLREWPSVQGYGAVGDGVTFDTTPFTNAAAEHEFVHVPEGMNCRVGSGLPYWKFYGEGKVFEAGVQWDLNRSPQTPTAAQKVYKERTFGIHEQAAGLSVSINSSDAQTRQNTQILGTSTQGLASQYHDRDHVALYTQAWSYEPDTVDGTTTYTSTTLTNTAVSALNAAGKLLPGTIIDTQHAGIYTGRIQSVSGDIITVDAWYLRPTGVAGTPANGTGAVINPNTKIWAQNSNLFLAGNAGNLQAQTGAGYELGLFCDPTTSGVNVWGFDAVTFQGKPEAHFHSRGSRTYGYWAKTGADYGFRSDTNGRGFSSNGDTVPFEMIGTGSWSVQSAGGSVSNGVTRIGVVPTQCTDVSFVNVGPLPAAYGGMFWVSGFNISGGAEACFLLMIRSGAVVTVSASDGSGLAIAFQASGRQLQIKCGNVGTFQFVAHGFVA